MFSRGSGFTHYRHCGYIYCKFLCQRPNFCLHLRLLNIAGLTTEVQQQWFIKHRFNLAVSSRFNDAHHRIDLWLINYCCFSLPSRANKANMSWDNNLSSEWNFPSTLTNTSVHVDRIGRASITQSVVVKLSKGWPASCFLLGCHSERFLPGWLIAVSLTQYCYK